MDGSVSDQLCQTPEEEERSGAKQNKIHTAEEAKRSEYEVLHSRFRRIGRNDQITSLEEKQIQTLIACSASFQHQHF